ncbi:hypothetical protein GOODEAATRI_025049 [Goodea atripinnis]|uniref:Uncharacterized protein n=1 Tax=Goodea atripinnis TaxID=208336 RepID=A0ABV0NN12_9TELE
MESSLLGPLTPRVFRSCCTDAPVKPLHPASTGNVNALHPACKHVADRSTYMSFLCSYAASICSSHGLVSSTIITALARAQCGLVLLTSCLWASRIVANQLNLNLRQSRLAAREDVLQVWVWGVPQLA